MRIEIRSWLNNHVQISGEFESKKDALEANRNSHLHRVDLRGVCLNHINLAGINLEHAKLIGAYLNFANLENANLREADMTMTSLVGANLTGADLFGTDLTYANLTGANLTNANLINATIRWAQLDGINLTGANLRYSCWSLDSLPLMDYTSVIGSKEVKLEHIRDIENRLKTLAPNKGLTK